MTLEGTIYYLWCNMWIEMMLYQIEYFSKKNSCKNKEYPILGLTLLLIFHWWSARGFFCTKGKIHLQTLDGCSSPFQDNPSNWWTFMFTILIPPRPLYFQYPKDSYTWIDDVGGPNLCISKDLLKPNLFMLQRKDTPPNTGRLRLSF